MTTATVTTLQLAPTKTFARRRVTWIPGECGHADGRIGTARITLQTAKHNRDSDQSDSYGVQESGDEYPAGVRGFLLRNDTDASQPDCYLCVVGSDAGGLVFDKCSCRAGKCGLACKHTAALTTLTSEGVV